jgi:hypothetical protein
MTQPTTQSENTHPATSEADQRIAALRSQLAMVQAERSLLHSRTGSLSTPPPAKHRHGIGGWIFAAFSFVFFLSMIIFAATRPPVVRVVEVTREVTVEVPAAPTPTPEVAVADTAPETTEEPTTGSRPNRPPRPRVTPTTSTMTSPMIDFERCAGDPLCGS